LARFVRYKAFGHKAEVDVRDKQKQQRVQQEFPEAESLLPIIWIRRRWIGRCRYGRHLYGNAYVYDEERAVGNLVSALKKSGSVIQIIRMWLRARIDSRTRSAVLRQSLAGTATQHYTPNDCWMRADCRSPILIVAQLHG